MAIKHTKQSVKTQKQDIKRQISEIKKNARATIRQKIPQKIERALFSVSAVVANKGMEYTPLAYSLLQNSQYHLVEATANGFQAVVGYTQEYALPLHSPEPGGKMDGWKPMDPYEREWRTRNASEFVGNGSGGWNPNARQDWLNVAYKEVEVDVNRIMLGDLEL